MRGVPPGLRCGDSRYPYESEGHKEKSEVFEVIICPADCLGHCAKSSGVKVNDRTGVERPVECTDLVDLSGSGRQAAGQKQRGQLAGQSIRE